MRGVVIVAHHDDEVLGFGGTIAKLNADHNASFHLLVLGEGITARYDSRIKSSITHQNEISNAQTKLYASCQRSADLIGFKSLTTIGLPDNNFEKVPFLDCVKYIEEFLLEIQPEIVFTHFPGDLNLDHKIVSEATVTACRPLPAAVVKYIYFGEVLSSTEWSINVTQQFIPNQFFDVSEFLEQKVKALECYDDEMRQFPHTRSIENAVNLARLRGASVGVSAAEAFVMFRGLK